LQLNLVHAEDAWLLSDVSDEYAIAIGGPQIDAAVSLEGR
jgi:hypothetical protein